MHFFVDFGIVEVLVLLVPDFEVVVDGDGVGEDKMVLSTIVEDREGQIERVLILMLKLVTVCAALVSSTVAVTVETGSVWIWVTVFVFVLNLTWLCVIVWVFVTVLAGHSVKTRD